MYKLTLALGALSSIFFMGTLAQAGTPDPRDAFSGVWTYAGDDVEEQARKKSIEAATQGLPGFVRGRARDRLGDRTKPIPELELSVQGEQVDISRDGQKLSLKAGADPVRLEHNGQKGDLSLRFDGPYMVLVSAGEKGERVATYSLSEAGNELTVAVRMKGDKLSNPIVYRSTYRRKS